MDNIWPRGIFVGNYKGVDYFAHQGKYNCLFGWVPQEFDSIRSFKLAVTKREKGE